MSAQLQVTGEAKIRTIQGPVVANSGVITALTGDASQYVRGDGTLAVFSTAAISAVSGTYLPLTGGTLTGPLTLTNGATTFVYRNNSSEIMDLQLSTEAANSKSKLSLLWYGNETASIKFKRGGDSTGGSLEFWTQADGGSTTQKMSILGNGNVLIGTTTDNGNKLQINGSVYSTGQMAAVVSSNVDLFTFINTGASFTKSCFVGSIADAGSTSSYYFYGQQSTSVVSLKIFTNGDIQNTNNSYGAISDARVKENIIDATPKLEDLMKIKVRNYNIIGESNKQIGVISQELEEIFPSMIQESTNMGETMKIKGVKYSVFIPMLIKAIQELKAEVDELKGKIS